MEFEGIISRRTGIREARGSTRVEMAFGGTGSGLPGYFYLSTVPAWAGHAYLIIPKGLLVSQGRWLHRARVEQFVNRVEKDKV